jgi:hypothetical protein
MEMNGQLHAPAALPPEKQLLIPTGYEEVKLNLSLCLTNHHATKTYGGAEI